MDTNRMGKISAVNYENGTVRVVYHDRDDCVTKEIPMAVFNNEYHMPSVGDHVQVTHMPNGSSQAYVVGDYWNKTHKPPDGAGKGVRRKDFSRSQGKAYWQYNDPEEGGDGNFTWNTEGDYALKSDGEISIKGAGSVKVESDGTVTIKGGSLELQSSGSITITGGNVTITGSVKIDGITFSEHTHECTMPGSPSGKPQSA